MLVSRTACLKLTRGWTHHWRQIHMRWGYTVFSVQSGTTKWHIGTKKHGLTKKAFEKVGLLCTSKLRGNLKQCAVKQKRGHMPFCLEMKKKD